MRNLCLLNKLLLVASIAISLFCTSQSLAQNWMDGYSTAASESGAIQYQKTQNPTVSRAVGTDSQGGSISLTSGGAVEQGTNLSNIHKGTIHSGDGGNCEPSEDDR